MNTFLMILRAIAWVFVLLITPEVLIAIIRSIRFENKVVNWNTSKLTYLVLSIVFLMFSYFPRLFA